MSIIINFKDLWRFHPSNNDDDYPCYNEVTMIENFENQCAIRMGVALERSGFDFSSYHGVKCWFGCNEIHVLRVEELALFLEARLGKPKSFHHINCDDFCRATDNASGIVVFLDFWGKGNQGDHVDLWNGECMTCGDPDYFERSRKVLFWELYD